MSIPISLASHIPQHSISTRSNPGPILIAYLESNLLWHLSFGSNCLCKLLSSPRISKRSSIVHNDVTSSRYLIRDDHNNVGRVEDGPFSYRNKRHKFSLFQQPTTPECSVSLMSLPTASRSRGRQLPNRIPWLCTDCRVRPTLRWRRLCTSSIF